MSEAVHDGSVKEVYPASVDRVIEDSPWKEQDAEGLASASEAVEDLGVNKPLEVETIAAAVGYIGVVKPTEIENVIPIEGINVKPESIVHDGSVKEIDPASVNRVLEDSPWKEHSAEGLVIASEVVEDVGVEKPLEVENIATVEEDIGVEKSIEIENVEVVEGVDVKPEPASELRIVIVHDGSVKEVDPASRDNMIKGSPWKEQDVEGLVSASEAVEDFGVEKPLEIENIVATVEDIGVVKPTEIENVVPIEGVDVKPESVSDVSIVVVHDGSVKEVYPASVDRVLEDCPWKEQNAEGMVTASEVVEDIGVKKPLEVENIAVVIEDISVEKFIEIENVVAIEGVDVKPELASEPSIVIVHHGSVKEVDPSSGGSVLEDSPWKEQNAGGLENSSEALEEFGAEKPLEVENIADVVEDIGVVKPTEIEDVVLVEGIDVKPESVSEVVHDGSVKEFDPVSTDSVLEDSHGKEQNAEGLATISEAVEDDGDDNGDKGFDYATLAPTGGPSYGNIIFSSQDGSGILNMDRAGGLGSSSPSLRPTAPHQPAGSNLFITSELALTDDPTEEMIEEEKKLHDKVELIRVKFLRLVYRLGATLEEMVVAQVLYRLSLVEGIIHGRQTNQAFSLDYTWKKALILEAERKEDLNFSCNILILGKTGVGKSATINSIFGEEKLKTDAFSLATTSMREIVGDVHGVKIRIIDTPGLRPSVMDQGSNRKILVAVKKYIKKCPPDIVLYVDRLDCLSRDLSDLPLLKTITAILGSSIWFDAIVALTHAASTPEGLNGAPMTYDVIMAQSSHIIQQSIRQAAGDMRLMNPVALVENHPSCRRNSEGQKVLPNGQSWRHQMLLLFYSSKILSEANSLLKLHDPNQENHFGFHFSSLALHFLLCSLLQSRSHPKLLVEHGGNEGNFDIELDDYSDVEQADDEEEYDQLPPFPDMVLPPSFDCDNPTYRYRFLEPTSTVQARPVLDAHGWDHDCGYDAISVEETLAILNRFPANVAVQVTKNKKEFSIHLDSSIAAKHGENASSLAGFDIQTVGRQLAYILRGESKIKNIKKNRTTGGFLVTFLGDTMATGLKVEDQLYLGKRLSLVAKTGAMRVQGDTAYGANLEARLKDKECPIGQSLSTLGLSLMKLRQDLALGANLQSQFSIGMGSKMALHLGLNNKLSGQITVKTSTSEQVQIALLGLMPVAASIYKSFRPSKP
nr:translocase of chloroplast 159, chloroplastic-like [Setaria viridis]